METQMKRIYQNLNWNCFPAAVASAFGEPINSLPPIQEDETASAEPFNHWINNQLSTWLGARGYQYFWINAGTRGWNLRHHLQETLGVAIVKIKHGPWKGEGHAVLYLRGRIVHDPAGKSHGHYSAPVAMCYFMPRWPMAHPVNYRKFEEMDPLTPEKCSLCKTDFDDPKKVFGPHFQPLCNACWLGYGETAREMIRDGIEIADYRRQEHPELKVP